MSCYLNLLRSSPHTRLLCRSVRSFSLIHQRSANLVSRRNGTNLFTKRFKSNDSISTKAAGEALTQKAKLKVSDLRRLLSLAKREKWKITGKLCALICEPDVNCSDILLFSRRDWLPHHFIINNDGCAVRSGKNPRHHLFE